MDTVARMGIAVRKSVMTGAIMALAFALAACATGPSAPNEPVRVNLKTLPAGASAAALGEDEVTRAILAAVNAYRARQDVPPLANDATLQRAAAVQSADMVLRKFYGHYNPEGQGPRERVMALNPAFNGDFAENLVVSRGMRGKTPAQIADVFLKQWVASPAHRKNLKNPAYTRSGVGIYWLDDALFATQVFAGP